jgi:hypothetical protein
MQTLIFNTTDKTVNVYSGQVARNSELIYQFDNVPTVKVQEGYYEVMQKGDDERSIPILRLPISGTNMRIMK